MVSTFLNGGTFRNLLLSVSLFLTALGTNAQNGKINGTVSPVALPDTTNSFLTPITTQNAGTNALSLRQCIDYALVHQPALNNALINVDVARATNAINLSGWLPQANASGNFLHYIQLPHNNTLINTGGGTTTGTGGSTSTGAGSTSTDPTGSTGSSTGINARGQNVRNSFVPGLTVSQAIFSPALLYTAKSASTFIKQAQQITDSTKIFLVTSISKSYYNVLLNLEQINILKEDTARLGTSLRDAYHQYKGGIVDETDYEEATITLNNSIAQLKQANENVIPQYASLKQLMGYPPEEQFNVSFDTTEMAGNIHIDTLQQLQYEKRIEYQQILTDKYLQSQLVKYYKSSFLPALSAFYNYNLAYQNDKFSGLFNNSFPNSLIGLSISVPIFTGFARLHNLHRAKLQEQMLNWNQTDLRSQIYTEYTSALASYKSNYYNLHLLQKNVNMAKRVYFVVTLQYRQGIVPYLNVINAESNLISSEINYLNALFQVLSTKIDLEKAMGNVSY